MKLGNLASKHTSINVQEVYHPPALFMGCGVVERHLEMAQSTKKQKNNYIESDLSP